MSGGNLNPIDDLVDRITKPDNVDHPSHYVVKTKSGEEIECLDVLETLGLGFHTGNAFKYLWRAGRKDPLKAIEDLKKAVFYLNREIKNLSNEI